MILPRLQSALRNRSGTAGIEFALVFPVFIFLFIGGITVFDLFRGHQQMIEANSVVSDIISRQTSVDKADLENLYSVFTNLQDASGAKRSLRISSIVRDDEDEYSFAWFEEAGEVSLLPPRQLDPKVLAASLPDIAAGDSLIVVEGARIFPVTFNVLDFGSITFQEQAFARPRFIGAVAYEGK